VTAKSSMVVGRLANRCHVVVTRLLNDTPVNRFRQLIAIITPQQRATTDSQVESVCQTRTLFMSNFYVM
jgi:hypothetical protein